MRHLNKPQLSISNIISDCIATYRDPALKQKFQSSLEYIVQQSKKYDALSKECKWSQLEQSDNVLGDISRGEMINLYERKFVGNAEVKQKYYDKIMSMAKDGICPICNIGHVRNLDHYLAKTIYPVFAVTPYNLIPICRDCNFEKSDRIIDDEKAPLHPYYDDIDEFIWLHAELIRQDNSVIAFYGVKSSMKKLNSKLYDRLVNHLNLYKLKRVYAIEATSEIAENMQLWKEIYNNCGKDGLIEFLKDCLNSKTRIQNNTWKTALYRALIDDNDILINAFT